MNDARPGEQTDAYDGHDAYDAAELNGIRRRLEQDFAGRVPIPMIDLVMQEEQDRLADATVRQFVPLLVERGARDRLRGLSGAPRPSN